MKPIKISPLLNGRLQSIDALRGLAALGVVLYHAVMQTATAVPNNLFRWPVKLLQFISSFGYIGVFLFFVISGFCIHLQWAKSRATQQPQAIKFGSFWRRRIRRLYPPYLIAFALFMLMAALTASTEFSGRSQSRSNSTWPISCCSSCARVGAGARLCWSAPWLAWDGFYLVMQPG